MKLLLKKLSTPINTSFSLQKDVLPQFDEGLHFHPEFELIYVLKGSGIKVVGDKMSRFAEGDLVLLGSNLPHLWRSNNAYQNGEHAEVVMIQFAEDFLGKDFFHKPAMIHIRKLLDRARSGLDIRGATHAVTARKITEMLNATYFPRILILLDILHLLAVDDNEKDLTELTDVNYNYTNMVSDTVRMDKVYKYIMEHFQHDVNLDEIASVASLSSSAFCKYFKKRTNKSFSIFLNEVKIGHACKLLMEKEGDKSISQICYESGFKSLTNFNRQFKALTNFTPYDYRRQYL